MKEWYPKRVLPPKFNFDIDLSNKTIVELSFLLKRNLCAQWLSLR